MHSYVLQDPHIFTRKILTKHCDVFWSCYGGEEKSQKNREENRKWEQCWMWVGVWSI